MTKQTQEALKMAICAFRKCSHKNGWYGNVRFWIFTKQIFMCSDCGEIIYEKANRKSVKDGL
jgi:hypothetical protein